MTAKRMHDVVKSGKEKLDKIGEILDLLKKKIEAGASYVGAVIEAATKVTDYLKSKKQESKKTLKQRGKKIIAEIKK